MLVPVVLDVVAYMDRREMKVPMLGKGWELNDLDPGRRTEIKQLPSLLFFLSRASQSFALR